MRGKRAPLIGPRVSNGVPRLNRSPWNAATVAHRRRPIYYPARECTIWISVRVHTEEAREERDEGGGGGRREGWGLAFQTRARRRPFRCAHRMQGLVACDSRTERGISMWSALYRLFIYFFFLDMYIYIYIYLNSSFEPRYEKAFAIRNTIGVIFFIRFSLKYFYNKSIIKRVLSKNKENSAGISS